MPDAFYRLLAFPNGIAMIALGYSLWQVARADAATQPNAVDAPQRQHGRCRMNTSPARPRTAPSPAPALHRCRRRGRRRTGWWVPPALLALAFIPVAGGTGRLIEVLGGPEVLPTDARFAASPIPLVVHIVAAVVYAVLGAFQFSARLRRRHPGWHRRAGRLLVVLGPRGRVLRAVDDAGLPPEGGHRRHPLGDPAAGQLGDGRQPHPRPGRHPQPRHRPPPGLDDPRVRARARRRHPGVHRRLRRGPSSAPASSAPT